jgi:hypothetical protein
VRSSAWICDFSSTSSTRARSGGLRYSPQMSWTFSMNCGSYESCHVSWRWGYSPNACQVRITASAVTPTSLAIERVDQCPRLRHRAFLIGQRDLNSSRRRHEPLLR